MGNNYDFCTSVRFSLSWNSLKYKKENNIDSYEFYFYQTLVDTVSLLALSLHLDHNLCESLAYVHGFSFCDYGVAGWEVIRKYLEDNNINVPVNKLKADITKRIIKSVNSQPSDDFFDRVDEMFSTNPITKEVKLVIECHRILKTLQPLKNINLTEFFKISDDVFAELKALCIEKNDIVSIDISKYISNDIPKLNYDLDEETSKRLYKVIKDSVIMFNKKYVEYSEYDNLLAAISYFINE